MAAFDNNLSLENNFANILKCANKNCKRMNLKLTRFMYGHFVCEDCIKYVCEANVEHHPQICGYCFQRASNWMPQSKEACPGGWGCKKCSEQP